MNKIEIPGEAESNVLANLIRSAIPGRETVFQMVDSIDGEEGRRLVIEHRELPEALPLQDQVARPLARSHVFHSIETFISYLGDHSLALADVDSQSIGAVLDETKDTDHELIAFVAKIHPKFAPWHALLNKATPVMAFAVHCMTHRRTVSSPDGLELAQTMSQIKASKAITHYTGVGKKSLNGVMVDLEIAGEKRGQLVELPEVITLTTPIYIDTAPVEVQIDLLITEAREEIVVYCTSTQYEEARIQAFQQFVERVQGGIEGRCGFGKIGHREWRVVE